MKKDDPCEDSSIILGVDPGTRVTGYGVISLQNRIYTPLDYGCITPPSRFKLSERYVVIFDSIGELIDKYRPSALVVEMQFMYKNAQSALKLGMARGAVMIAAKKRGLLVYQYAPTVAKRAVVGRGRASKFQVQGMVQRILQLASLPHPEDAADALALAICHAQAAAHLKTQHEV
jgi:crossover junction endodeoxyribonuclease RuvC